MGRTAWASVPRLATVALAAPSEGPLTRAMAKLLKNYPPKQK